MRTFLLRLFDGVFRGRRERRLAEEVDAHLALLADDYERRGLTPEEARCAARRAFGGVDQMTARYRDQRGLPVLDALGQDVRFALRLFSRERAFALTAVLVLGLGIGVNHLFFTLIYAHTLRGLPISRADRVVDVSTLDERGTNRGLSYLDVDDLRLAIRGLTGLAAFANAPVALGDEGRTPERRDVTYASANAFVLIGVTQALGRTFDADDDRPGAIPVVMLSERLWQERYGADPAILGRSVLINGAPATVVGVMRDRSGFPSTADVWLPLAHLPGIASERRDARSLRAFGRLRDGVELDDARAELQSAFDRLALEYPETNKGMRARVIPVNERYLGRLEGAWFAFMAAGIIAVIIASANVANLVLAHSLQRAREIAIRTSLGANRRRVLRQLLIEGGVLATLGGLLGLGLAVAGARLARGIVPDGVLPYWIDYSMDARLAASLIAVSTVSVLVFSLIPALRASKTDVNRVLKDGGRTGTVGRASRHWASVFLTAQLALGVLLFAQLTTQLRYSRTSLPSDIAIESPDLITASIALPPDKYGTPGERANFYRGLDERLSGMPGVSDLSMTSHLPLLGAAERGVDIEGQSRGAGESAHTARTVSIAPRYFATLNLPLVRGREFSEADGAPGAAHAIVNERFAALFFGVGDPIGRRIALSTPGVPAQPPAWLTIVGVSQTIRQSPRPDREPIVYAPLADAAPATAALIVRSHVDAAALVTTLRREVLALDPHLPLYRTLPMARVAWDAEWNGRLSETLATTVILISLALAAFGLYAVTAHGVSLRSREIGVRVALGARPLQVVRAALTTVTLPMILGFVLGILGTIAWARAFATEVEGVGVTDPEQLAVITISLAVIAGIACFVPVRRATRVDPVAVLRDE